MTSTERSQTRGSATQAVDFILSDNCPFLSLGGFVRSREKLFLSGALLLLAVFLPVIPSHVVSPFPRVPWEGTVFSPYRLVRNVLTRGPLSRRISSSYNRLVSSNGIPLLIIFPVSYQSFRPISLNSLHLDVNVRISSTSF